jgi:hypothetical protein
MADALYDTDILVWSETQADLLSRIASGERVNGVDWEHVVEEIADVGISQLNAVGSLLFQMMLHLLKTHLWPEDSARMHWRVELIAFHGAAKRHYAPSMRQRLEVASDWQRARSMLGRELADHPAFKALPEECPWSVDDLMHGDLDALLATLSG